MRLINCRSFEVEEFITDDEIPAYAVLSHTWGSAEVKLQEMALAATRFKEGYKKIRYCCDQAIKDGLDWAWVDTCCIDKTSSSELSEAINSMFRWYQDAKACYVYLSDVDFDESQPSTSTAGADRPLPASFFKSRWFLRGWTLQELLAPSDVVFYTSKWERLGSKLSLAKIISDITRIDESALTGEESILSFTVGTRMSWAARRKTSRREDTAYCLFGIFGVYMPLIYGEGHHAFQRLQKAIMQTTSDHTLFAWGPVVPYDDMFITHGLDIRPDFLAAEWISPEKRTPLLGLLALSPADFVDANRYTIEPAFLDLLDRKGHPRPTETDGGIAVSLPTWTLPSYSSRSWDRPRITQSYLNGVILLGCYIGFDSIKGRQYICIPIIPWGPKYLARRPQLTVIMSGGLNETVLTNTTKVSKIKAPMSTHSWMLRNGDIVFAEYRRLPMMAEAWVPAFHQAWSDVVVVNNLEAFIPFPSVPPTTAALAVLLFSKPALSRLYDTLPHFDSHRAVVDVGFAYVRGNMLKSGADQVPPLAVQSPRLVIALTKCVKANGKMLNPLTWRYREELETLVGMTQSDAAVRVATQEAVSFITSPLPFPTGSTSLADLRCRDVLEKRDVLGLGTHDLRIEIDTVPILQDGDAAEPSRWSGEVAFSVAIYFTKPERSR